MPRLVPDPDRARFMLCEGDTVLGLADYRLDGTVLALPHVEVDPAHGGRGHGSTLVREVLDHAAAHGLTVDPQCPFVRAWIAEHPGYQRLVAAGRGLGEGHGTGPSPR